MPQLPPKSVICKSIFIQIGDMGADAQKPGFAHVSWRGGRKDLHTSSSRSPPPLVALYELRRRSQGGGWQALLGRSKTPIHGSRISGCSYLRTQAPRSHTQPFPAHLAWHARHRLLKTQTVPLTLLSCVLLNPEFSSSPVLKEFLFS